MPLLVLLEMMQPLSSPKRILIMLLQTEMIYCLVPEFPAFGFNALERSRVLGNSALKAETTLAYEWGVDMKLWKGKLDMSFSWYKTITKEQVVFTQLSAPSGYLSIPQNAGKIENKGFEVDLGIQVH